MLVVKIYMKVVNNEMIEYCNIKYVSVKVFNY